MCAVNQVEVEGRAPRRPVAYGMLCLHGIWGIYVQDPCPKELKWPPVAHFCLLLLLQITFDYYFDVLFSCRKEFPLCLP